MSDYVHAAATTARLDAALAASPSYLHPVLLAVRDYRVGFLFTAQGSGAFSIPTKPKRVAIISLLGDDMEQSTGPDGFHMPSVRRVIRQCAAFAVVSSGGMTDVYAAMSAAAIGGRNVLIVETRIEHEFQWAGLIQKLAPKRPLIISTVKGGRA